MVNPKIVAKKTGKEPTNDEKLITSRMSRLARRRENLLSAADQAKEKAKFIRANPASSENPAFASYANARRSKYYRDLASDVEKKRIGLKAGMKSKPESSVLGSLKQQGVKDAAREAAIQPRMAPKSAKELNR